MTTILNASLIRLMTALIPVKRVRVRVRRRLLDRARDARTARLVPIMRARYAAHEQTCRDKLARGERLRVAFLVCDASMFSAEPVFQAMVDDARFDPFLAVVPRRPKGPSVIAFHGNPDIPKAIAGFFTHKGEKNPRHLACLPTPWVKELWENP